MAERQLPLDLAPPPDQVKLWRAKFDGGSYPTGFWTWLESNQHVLDGFIRLALKTRGVGVTRWSSDAICHVLRWQTAIRERGQSSLKINDHATAGLARLAMAMRPQLRGFFTLRTPPARDEARHLDGDRYPD